MELDEELEQEVLFNERFFSGLGLIGRLKGFWPSLIDLHQWISHQWEGLLEGVVQIYPMARGFFIMVFEKAQDRKKILCDYHWEWEEKFPLMLKPWHLAFNPATEVFEKVRI